MLHQLAALAWCRQHHRTFCVTSLGIITRQNCICILDLDDTTPTSFTLSEATPTSLCNVPGCSSSSSAPFFWLLRSCEGLLSTFGLQTRPGNRWGSHLQQLFFHFSSLRTGKGAMWRAEPCRRWKQGWVNTGTGWRKSFRKFLRRTKRLTQSLVLKSIATFLSLTHTLSIPAFSVPCVRFSFFFCAQRNSMPFFYHIIANRTDLFTGTNFAVTGGLSF